MRSLIDPRMRTRLRGYWPSICTVQLEKFVQEESGQQKQTGGSDIDGLTKIPCRIGPLIEVRPTDDEIRAGGVVEEYRRRQCKLDGFFPNIQPSGMQAVVDGVVYPIRGVEHDSEKFSTRLKLEVLTL